MQIPKRKSEQKIKPVKQDPFITQAKHDELKKKLQKMVKIIRPILSEEVQRLAQLGDFSENAEYQIAKGKLRGLNNRILKLEDQLNHCQIIPDQQSTDQIRIGHTVKILLNNIEKTYKILGSTETNPTAGIISQNSPLGQALLGRQINDEFSVQLGDKISTVKILEIK